MLVTGAVAQGEAVPELDTIPQEVVPQSEWIGEVMGWHYSVFDPFGKTYKGSMVTLNWASQCDWTGLLGARTHFMVEEAPPNWYLTAFASLYFSNGQLYILVGSWHAGEFTVHYKQPIPEGHDSTDLYFFAFWKQSRKEVGYYIYNDTKNMYVQEAHYFAIPEGYIAYCYACSSALEYSDPSFTRNVSGMIRWEMLLCRTWDWDPWMFFCFSSGVVSQTPYKDYPEDQFDVCWIDRRVWPPGVCSCESYYDYRYYARAGCKLDKMGYLPMILRN